MAPNVFGDLLIVLGFAFNILAGLFFILTAMGKSQFENLAFKAYHLFTAVVTIAVFYLSYLFFSGEYIVKYVHDYSDSTLSFFYTLSALWGGQEGTYLLWLAMNAWFGYIIIFKTAQYRNIAMGVFSIVNLFFLFLLIKLSPFALLNFVPADGAGLNPLLQDPWMVIHPPVIFVGYSMAGVLFSIAIASLIMKDYSSWVQKVFPWAAITALMLAAGNILGGYWAYKTLGWGGFWAWDPVENSSFIPWFVSLAVIHGLIIEKRTGALRRTNLLMTMFVFILVIYGTFLTRSGVLADFSVHSFVDLGINQYLVVFLVLYLLMSVVFFLANRINILLSAILLLLFIITTFFTGGNQYIGIFITVYIFGNLLVIIPQQTKISSVPLNYNIYGKEFILFAGMMLLFGFSVIVLIWTSLPILTNIFASEPSAADIATYNRFALPFAIIYSLLLTVAPFLTYNTPEVKNWQSKAAIFGVVAAAIGAVLYFLLDVTLALSGVFAIVFYGLMFYLLMKDSLSKLVPAIAGFIITILIAYFSGVTNTVYTLFFALAAMVTVSNLISIIKHFPSSLKIVGAQISHLGFGLMLIGILGSSVFSTNEQLVIPRGSADEAYGISVMYNGMENDLEYPKNKLLVSYYDQSGNENQARPELYYSARLDGFMKKPYVENNLLYDLYFSPLQVQDLQNNGNIVLKKHEPLVVGDYVLTFKDFEMSQGQHDAEEGMTVKVLIDVEDAEKKFEIAPAVAMKSGSGRETIDMPATFGNADQYKVSVQQILADQGAVSVSIPGLKQAGPPDRLILDISKKPIINFLWLGTILIMLGAVVVFFRRKAEIA